VLPLVDMYYGLALFDRKIEFVLQQQPFDIEASHDTTLEGAWMSLSVLSETASPTADSWNPCVQKSSAVDIEFK